MDQLARSRITSRLPTKPVSTVRRFFVRLTAHDAVSVGPDAHYHLAPIVNACRQSRPQVTHPIRQYAAMWCRRACSTIIATVRGVEQSLSVCFDGQLYQSADALFSDAALSLSKQTFLTKARVETVADDDVVVENDS